MSLSLVYVSAKNCDVCNRVNTGFLDFYRDKGVNILLYDLERRKDFRKNTEIPKSCKRLLNWFPFLMLIETKYINETNIDKLLLKARVFNGKADFETKRIDDIRGLRINNINDHAKFYNSFFTNDKVPVTETSRKDKDYDTSDNYCSNINLKRENYYRR